MGTARKKTPLRQRLSGLGEQPGVLFANPADYPLWVPEYHLPLLTWDMTLVSYAQAVKGRTGIKVNIPLGALLFHARQEAFQDYPRHDLIRLLGNLYQLAYGGHEDGETQEQAYTPEMDRPSCWLRFHNQPPAVEPDPSLRDRVNQTVAQMVLAPMTKIALEDRA